MRLPTRFLAVAAAVTAALGSLAAIEAQTTDTLYLRVSGDCPGTTFLSTTPGVDELSCGYVGGLPFGEVFETETAGSTATSYTEFDLGAVVLDASRPLTTTISIGSYFGVGGVGEVQIIGTVTAKIDGATERLQSFDVTEMVDPAADDHVFVLPQDLDAAFDRATADDITLTLTVRGLHLFHGFVGSNGDSFIDVPTVEITETEEPVSEEGGTDAGTAEA